MLEERHPIAEVALRGIVTGKKEPLALSDDGAKAVREALHARIGKPDLRDAVLELVILACFLELKKSSPTPARALLEIAGTVEQALKAQGLTMDQVMTSGKAENRMASLLGQGRPARDEKPAEGGGQKWWELKR